MTAHYQSVFSPGLFDGRVMHRDSEQHVQEIAPGAMNLLTAGRGIAHSERTPPLERASPHALFGIQSWIALPLVHEEIPPSFQHFDAATLPLVEEAGWRARVIAGSAFGQTSPVHTMFDWFYSELLLAQDTSAPLDPDYEDRAVYVVDGSKVSYSNIGEEDSDRTLSSFGLSVHMLSQGDRFDLLTRTPHAHPADSMEQGKKTG